MGGKAGKELDTKTLKRISQATHFQKDEVVDLWNVFIKHASGSGKSMQADRATFHKIIKEAHDRHPNPEFPDFDPNLLSDLIFEEFDSDRNGCIDFAELVSGLSVRCRGTAEELTEFVFNTFDTYPRDGYITKDEMLTKLSRSIEVSKKLLAVQMKMAETELAKEAEVGDSLMHINQLVAARAAEKKELEIKSYIDRVFWSADRNMDGKISLDEFKQYVQSDNKLLCTQTPSAPFAMSDEELQECVDAVVTGQWVPGSPTKSKRQVVSTGLPPAAIAGTPPPLPAGPVDHHDEPAFCTTPPPEGASLLAEH